MRRLVSQILFVIFCCFVIACSATKRNGGSSSSDSNVYGTKEYADAFVSMIRPRWFDTVERFKLVDNKKEIVPHRFWDVAPSIDLKKKTINAIITTPEASEYGFGLDLQSGQMYVSRKFCAQSDKTKKYTGTIKAPPFSIGVIPRILDQLNQPQKVIVFGGKDYFENYHRTHFFDVRIVGAYIEQICPYGACMRKDQWLSRLVLVAVQNGHKKYKEVQNLGDLRNIVDWDYVRAFIENGFGSNKLADKFYPGFRMGAEVTAGQALSFMERNATIFSIKRLANMRMSCYKLYDYIWKDLSYISADEIVAKDKKAIREKAIKLNQSVGKQIAKVKPFYRRFIKNFKKYHEQFKTCSKYIYPASINDSPERYWFFVYYSSFHHLHDLGYTFDCNGNKWTLNPYVGKNSRALNLKEQMINCSARDIDVAMEYAVKTLENIRKKNRKSYRYIDYDKGQAGTHSKIYSWVGTEAKIYSCNEKSDSEFILNKASFPQDIKWKKRGKEGKTDTELGEIIY